MGFYRVLSPTFVLFFLVLLNITACATLPKPLYESVRPIDMKAFKPIQKKSADLMLSSTILANAAYRAQLWATKDFKSSANDDRFIITNVNKEHEIRPATSAALSLAVAIFTGIDENAVGLSQKQLKKLTVKLIKGAAAVHKSNGGQWGDHWQSSLWAAQLGRAGWILWPELDNETKGMVANLVQYEANRNYKVRYWNGKGGDSKSEENSWDSMIFHLAIVMFPQHSHIDKWKLMASSLMMGSYCRPSDMQKETPLIDGRSPKDWLNGYNVRDDGIVINHNLIHNDYMAAIAQLQMTGIAVFSLAGVPAPQSIDFNFDAIYKAAATKVFKTPPYQAPGGTMFIPGSADQYYPEGTDWSTRRYATFYGMDALADVLGYDKDLPYKAAKWKRLRAEKILQMQSRHADKRLYAKGEHETYPGKENMAFWAIAEAHLIQWLSETGNVTQKENWFE